MAFTDWEAFKSSGSFGVFATEATQSIEGSQSLIIGQTGGVSHVNVVATVASGLTQGVISGRLRTFVEKKTLASASAAFGIVCMQSAKDVTAAATSGYTLEVNDSNLVSIIKFTNGLNAGRITLASTTVGSIPDDQTFAIELMWFYNAMEYNGTRLVAKIDEGPPVDFSGLVEVLDVIDTTTPLITSVAEGLCWIDLGAGTDSEILFDTTTLYSVSFI